MKKYIGLMGKAGSGKTTIAENIRLAVMSRNNGDEWVEVISFATPLKMMMMELLAYGGVPNPHDYIRGELKTEPLACLGGVTARKAMQTLGTEWGRELIDEELWTNLAKEKAQKSQAQFIVFDDMRFMSEMSMISDLGGSIFTLHRGADLREVGNDPHISEAVPDGGFYILNDDPYRCANRILDLVLQDD